MDIGDINRRRLALFQRTRRRIRAPRAPLLVRMALRGNVLRYDGSSDEVGCWMAENPFASIKGYFEVTILSTGVRGMISVGLVNNTRRIDIESVEHQPGWLADTVAFYADDGKLYDGSSVGQKFGPKCRKGDVIGCGIYLDADDGLLKVFFTKNGIKIGSVKLSGSDFNESYFPTVGMQSLGEEVLLDLEVKWNPEDEGQMLVDSMEDVWHHLHRVKVTGTLLEYVGEGNHEKDVGLAQTQRPLTTRFHYYEVEVIGAGKKNIALGLTSRNYPKNALPGLRKGSVAYHGGVYFRDGRMYRGGDGGHDIGSCCNEGDIFGCGILFPRNYSLDDADEVDDCDLELFSEHCDVHNESYAKSGAERGNVDPHGKKVTVFFTRNRKQVVRTELVLPEGGFYPTIGMMNTGEKVRVELYPLSG
ncbi:uncharacterized protein V6R79_017215 [Siganus canaliculatus]